MSWIKFLQVPEQADGPRLRKDHAQSKINFKLQKQIELKDSSKILSGLLRIDRVIVSLSDVGQAFRDSIVRL